MVIKVAGSWHRPCELSVDRKFIAFVAVIFPVASARDKEPESLGFSVCYL